MADSLNLLTDVQLAGVDVGQVPGEAEDFSFTQTQHQNQDERGV